MTLNRLHTSPSAPSNIYFRQAGIPIFLLISINTISYHPSVRTITRAFPKMVP